MSIQFECPIKTITFWLLNPRDNSQLSISQLNNGYFLDFFKYRSPNSQTGANNIHLLCVGVERENNQYQVDSSYYSLCCTTPTVTFPYYCALNLVAFPFFFTKPLVVLEGTFPLFFSQLSYFPSSAAALLCCSSCIISFSRSRPYFHKALNMPPSSVLRPH